MEGIDERRKALLDTLYESTSLPSSFASVNKLFRAAKAIEEDIKLKHVKEYLKSKDAYTLHKTTRKKFPRRKMVAPRPGVIATCDLADVGELSRYNNGVKYLLVCVDIFSRYAKVLPLKRKNAPTLLKSLKKILESEEFSSISRIHTDKGGEFYNKVLDAYLKSRNIKLYSVSSYEIKASLAERFIKTLKNKIYRYLTNNNTHKYLPVLDDIVQSYNTGNHRSLGGVLTPEKVHRFDKEEDIKRLFSYMYKKTSPKVNIHSSTLPIGSNVRLSGHLRNSIFNRGFKKQNTLEIFTVEKVDKTQQPPIYFLKDLNGDPIEGIFYREELTPTTLPEYFPIRILGRKKIGDKLHYKVSWVGYPETFQTYVPASDIKRV